MDMENMDQTLSQEEELLEMPGEMPELEDFQDEIPAEETELETPAEPAPVKKKIPAWKIFSAAVAMVLVLCALTVGLLYGMGKRWEDFFPKNDIGYKASYMVSDEKAHENAAKVIAQVGDMKLTNDVLNILYWSTVSQYYSSYYSYIDLSAPLAEQTCIMDETMSWEQFFLQEALDNWHTYASLCLQAEADGYQYSQELMDEMTALPETLAAAAQENEMESVDALMKASYGAGATEAGYLRYDELLMKSMTYFSDLYEQNVPTDEEIENFYTEHSAELEQAGYGKDAGNQANVRHILIKVDDFKETAQAPAEENGEETTEPTTEETTAEETSQEAWDACYAEAERILALWQSGEATEDSFAALVEEYTDDTGSATTGGLYEGIMPGSGYVQPFLEWSISAERQPGDTGIVQVDDYYQGYHIMYYVSGEPVWSLVSANDLLTERMSEIVDKVLDTYPMETNFKKIVLGSIDLG